ncbi:MAG: DinB family protein [Acidimicrobiales bacterium]
MTIDWPTTLLFQLTWHWERQLRPRLDGLTDAEYLWEPVPGAWSIRPRSQARTTISGGAGDLVAEFEQPEPSPAPVTTIAWRLGHILVGVLGARNASHFGWEPVDYFSKVYPATADQALAELDTEYERWIAGVTGLSEEGLARPIGPSEGEWAEHSYADLVLHIHRELIHHGAEIALLRDLYAHRS